MPDLSAASTHFRFLESLALQQTVIHRRHPLAKLLTTLGFLIIALSYGKYEVGAVLPLILFPVVLTVLGELPPGQLLKRALIAAPLVLGVGIFNPVFDQTPLLRIGAIAISGGWLSLASLLLRLGLTVTVSLILIATSGIGQVAAALLSLGLPRLMVTQLLFMYRYISVLGEETTRMLRAYSFRSLREGGIHFKAWGSLAGQLLLRTLDRAERIYQAMRCRGFDGQLRLAGADRFRWPDAAYCGGWMAFFILARVYNLPELLGSVAMGVGR
jgi:cobalt/nickel transport system permease protein